MQVSYQRGSTYMSGFWHSKACFSDKESQQTCPQVGFEALKTIYASCWASQTISFQHNLTKQKMNDSCGLTRQDLSSQRLAEKLTLGLIQYNANTASLLD